MKPYQRQLILLVVVMSLLVVIFLFISNYKPSTEKSAPQDNSVNTSQNYPLPEPVNQSIEGWKQLLDDIESSKGLLFQTGNTS